MADEEHAEDFNYIVRLMNTDLDGEQPTLYALRGIKGVGTRVAESIVRDAEVDPSQKIGTLEDQEVEKLKGALQRFSDMAPEWMFNRKRDPHSGKNLHLFGNDLDLTLREDFNRLKKISCYRGIRHEQGQKVRGQRTRSNGRSGMTVGVQRRKVMGENK
ncbi:MAG: 30S ribosomal protein S13 [Thermoplasmata archaeon]